MARVLIVGGGFGGVVAAESLAKKLGCAHEITLMSRSHKFLFYPALVRLAFGECGPDDIAFDVREAMLDRRIRFIESEVARIDPHKRHVTFAHGDLVGLVQARNPSSSPHPSRDSIRRSTNQN
jgi:sulfide:quinone oxidoreductase